MSHPKDLHIADYTYALPDERIARNPLPARDASKLLLYRNGEISETIFKNLPDHLPADSLLVFNQTKVIHARLLFQKPSGSVIEIFCLSPHENDMATAMAQHGKATWQCLVGGAGKWKHGMLLSLACNAPAFTLTAAITARMADSFIITFHWDNDALTFADILQAAGKVPLPPYLHRDVTVDDESRYQTVFARQEGSVAAPTASLHFTEEMMAEIAARGIASVPLTLHVGAGTFRPVKAARMDDHHMHSEWIEVTETSLRQITAGLAKPVIAIGTTALRTLESLYWLGSKTMLDPEIALEKMIVGQWEPYDMPSDILPKTALEALLRWMQRQGITKLVTRTEILLAPGYTFRMADALVTNFHQPQSTLLLLVAAFIGDDWKRVYDYALGNNFRFLSYGDGSLLWRNHLA